MSTTLHILVDHQNVISWQVVLNYMQRHPIQYYLESSRRAAYVDTQPNSTQIFKFSLNVCVP